MNAVMRKMGIKIGPVETLRNRMDTRGNCDHAQHKSGQITWCSKPLSDRRTSALSSPSFEIRRTDGTAPQTFLYDSQVMMGARGG
jgi:hypothetical protein